MNRVIAQVTSPLPLYTRDSFSSFSSSEDYHGSARLGTDGDTFITTESRRDRHLSTASVTPDATLPSYMDSNRDAVPEYSATYEPVTFAMYLYRFGFLFPPFWILGAFILLTPLRFPPFLTPGNRSGDGTWLSEKTEAEKQAFIGHTRKAELKYAKRCFIALLVLFVSLALFTGMAIWALK